MKEDIQNYAWDTLYFIFLDICSNNAGAVPEKNREFFRGKQSPLQLYRRRRSNVYDIAGTPLIYYVYV